MPLYTYSCSKCGHEDDVLRRMATQIEKCPKCGDSSFRKIDFHKDYKHGLQFVGEGFSASTIKEK